MELAQRVVYLVRSMRSRSELKVRQPLARISIPASDAVRNLVGGVRTLILDEINVKDIEFVDERSPIIQKSASPNFRRLGPRFGKNVNSVARRVRSMTTDEINQIETSGSFRTEVDGTSVDIDLDDLSITTRDIEGWMVESADGLTVALDTTLTPELRDEGMAREFVNRVQNMRRDAGLEITDRILIGFKAGEQLSKAILNMSDYVMSETLALAVESNRLETDHKARWEIDGQGCEIGISKAP